MKLRNARRMRWLLRLPREPPAVEQEAADEPEREAEDDEHELADRGAEEDEIDFHLLVVQDHEHPLLMSDFAIARYRTRLHARCRGDVRRTRRKRPLVTIAQSVLRSGFRYQKSWKALPFDFANQMETS